MAAKPTASLKRSKTMSKITTNQSHSVMATLAMNADWDSIDFEESKLQEGIIRNPVEAGKEFALFLRNGAKMLSKPLLTYIRDFSASAHPAITTSQKFWEDAGVKWMGDTFKTQFIGLEVAAASAATLILQKLDKNSLYAKILSDLGVKAETSVLHFSELLHQNCESSKFFIGYLKGNDGNLFAVYAGWDVGRGGWDVGANSVTDPRGWFAGRVVVSRK